MTDVHPLFADRPELDAPAFAMMTALHAGVRVDGDEPFLSWSNFSERQVLAAKAAAAAVWDAATERAKIAAGDIYKDRYRTWPFWPIRKGGGRGNLHHENPLVRHCDRIADMIRAGRA